MAALAAISQASPVFGKNSQRTSYLGGIIGSIIMAIRTLVSHVIILDDEVAEIQQAIVDVQPLAYCEHQCLVTNSGYAITPNAEVYNSVGGLNFYDFFTSTGTYTYSAAAGLTGRYRLDVSFYGYMDFSAHAGPYTGFGALYLGTQKDTSSTAVESDANFGVWPESLTDSRKLFTNFNASLYVDFDKLGPDTENVILYIQLYSNVSTPAVGIDNIPFGIDNPGINRYVTLVWTRIS